MTFEAYLAGFRENTALIVWKSVILGTHTSSVRLVYRLKIPLRFLQLF